LTNWKRIPPLYSDTERLRILRGAGDIVFFQRAVLGKAKKGDAEKELILRRRALAISEKLYSGDSADLRIDRHNLRQALGHNADDMLLKKNMQRNWSMPLNL